MSIKKLAVIVLAAVVLMAGAIGISMKLTAQREVEMEVADIPKQQEEQPETGETRTFGSMENIPLYYDDEKKLLLPLRNVTEGLGGSVQWERELRQAEISCMGRVLTLSPGHTDAVLNGYDITLPEPAEMINGCLYINSELLADYFNAEVLWNNDSRQVTLKTSDLPAPTAAVCRMEGKKGGRAYEIEAPVVIGLNDKKFEKSLNESLATELRTIGEDYLNAPEDAEGALRLRMRTDFLTSEFISLWWNGEKDGLPYKFTKNIDLKEQKAVSLPDLLAVGSVEEVEAVLDGRWQNGGFYLSQTEGLVLMQEGKNGGTEAYIWPKERELRWKVDIHALTGGAS